MPILPLLLGLLLACHPDGDGSLDGQTPPGSGGDDGGGSGTSGGTDGGEDGGDDSTSDTAEEPEDTGPTVDPNDKDGDGYPKSEDCDDDDPNANAGVVEDCNNLVDDGCKETVAPCGWGNREVDARTVATAILVGEEGLDYAGGSVALGDLNADGVVDAVVGAYQAADETGGDGGAVYIALGPLSGEIDLGSQALVIRQDGTKERGWLGKSTRVDDVNGDGFDDLIATEPYRNYWDEYHEGVACCYFADGRTYVWYGPITTAPDTDATDFLFRHDGYIIGTPSTMDIDGDGMLDLVIPPATFVDLFSESTDADVVAHIVLGPVSGVGGLGGDRPEVTLVDEGDGENSYRLPRRMADLDGDGVDDFVSAQGMDIHGNFRIVILKGPQSGTVSSGDYDAIWSSEVDTAAGCCSFALGDADNDGIADLAVGDSGINDNAGAAYLVTSPALTSGSLEDATTVIYADPDSVEYEALAAFEMQIAPVDSDAAADWTITSLNPAGEFTAGGTLIFGGPISAGTLTPADAEAVLASDSTGGPLGRLESDWARAETNALLVGSKSYGSTSLSDSPGAAFFFTDMEL